MNTPVFTPTSGMNTENTVLSTKSNRMATAIPPSPLKILRDDSVDGTLSPVSSKSTGTDTDTDTRKKVSFQNPVNSLIEDLRICKKCGLLFSKNWQKLEY